MQTKHRLVAKSENAAVSPKQAQTVARLQSCIEYIDISDLIMHYYKNQSAKQQGLRVRGGVRAAGAVAAGGQRQGGEHAVHHHVAERPGQEDLHRAVDLPPPRVLEQELQGRHNPQLHHQLAQRVLRQLHYLQDHYQDPGDLQHPAQARPLGGETPDQLLLLARPRQPEDQEAGLLRRRPDHRHRGRQPHRRPGQARRDQPQVLAAQVG